MFLKSVLLVIVSIAVSVESEYLKFYKNYFLAKYELLLQREVVLSYIAFNFFDYKIRT